MIRLTDKQRKDWAVKAIMYYDSIAYDLPEDMRETPEAIHDVLGDWLYDREILTLDEIDDICNLAVKMKLGI